MDKLFSLASIGIIPVPYGYWLGEMRKHFIRALRSGKVPLREFSPTTNMYAYKVYFTDGVDVYLKELNSPPCLQWLNALRDYKYRNMFVLTIQVKVQKGPNGRYKGWVQHLAGLPSHFDHETITCIGDTLKHGVFVNCDLPSPIVYFWAAYPRLWAENNHQAKIALKFQSKGVKILQSWVMASVIPHNSRGLIIPRGLALSHSAFPEPTESVMYNIDRYYYNLLYRLPKYLGPEGYTGFGALIYSIAGPSRRRLCDKVRDTLKAKKISDFGDKYYDSNEVKEYLLELSKSKPEEEK